MKRFLLVMLAVAGIPKSTGSIPTCSKSTKLCRDIEAGSRVGIIHQDVEGKVIIKDTELLMNQSSEIDLRYGGNLEIRSLLKAISGIEKYKIKFGPRSKLVCSYGNPYPPHGPYCNISIFDRPFVLEEMATISVGRANLEFHGTLEFSPVRTIFGEGALFLLNDQSKATIEGHFEMENRGVPPRIVLGNHAKLTLHLYGELNIAGFLYLERTAKLDLWLDTALILDPGSKMILKPGSHLNVYKRDPWERITYHPFDEKIGKTTSRVYLRGQYNLLFSSSRHWTATWIRLNLRECMELFLGQSTNATAFTYRFVEGNWSGICKVGSMTSAKGRIENHVVTGIIGNRLPFIQSPCSNVNEKDRFFIRQSVKKSSVPAREKFLSVNIKLGTVHTTFKRTTSFAASFINWRYHFTLEGARGKKVPEALALGPNDTLVVQPRNDSDISQSFELLGDGNACRIRTWRFACLSDIDGPKFSAQGCQKNRGLWTFNRASDYLREPEIVHSILSGLETDSLFEIYAPHLDIGETRIEIKRGGSFKINAIVDVVIGYGLIINPLRTIAHFPPSITVGRNCRLTLTHGHIHGNFSVARHSTVELISLWTHMIFSRIEADSESIIGLSARKVEIIRSRIRLAESSVFLCRARYIIITNCLVDFFKQSIIRCNDIQSGTIKFADRLNIPYNTELVFEKNARVLGVILKAQRIPALSSAQKNQRYECRANWTELIEEREDGTLDKWCVYWTDKMSSLTEWQRMTLCYELEGLWIFKENDKEPDADPTVTDFDGNKLPNTTCRRRLDALYNVHYLGVNTSRITFNISGANVRDKFTKLKLIFKENLYIHGEMKIINQHWSLLMAQMTFRKKVYVNTGGKLIVDLAKLPYQSSVISRAIKVLKNETTGLHDIIR